MNLKKAYIILILQITSFHTLENFINRHFSNTTIVIFSSNIKKLSEKLYFLLKLTQPKIIANQYFDSRLSLDLVNFIFIEDNLNNLTTSIQLQHGNFNTSGHFLVIYQRNTTDDVLKQTFKTLLQFHIYNVVILTNLTQFVTWYPYDKHSYCGSRVILINQKSLNMFAEKLPNTFENCQINVTWNSYSYAIRSPYDSDNPGFAIRFLNTLARQLKIKINYIKLSQRYRTLNRIQYEKFVEEMTSRDIDIGVLAQTMSGVSHQKVRILNPIFLTKQFFVFPPRQQLKSQNKILEIFTMKVWGTILLSLCGIILFWKFLTQISVLDSVFFVLQLAFQSVPLPQKRLYRWIFLLFVFYITNLNWMYLSRLSSVLTQPDYEPKIKTLNDLTKSDKKIKFGVAFERHLESFGEEIYKNLLKRRIDNLGNTSLVKMFQDFAREMNHGILIAETEMAWFKNPKELEVVSYDEVIQPNIIRTEKF